jgi:leucyl/phenylalanyl-tRNA--protein transferase
MSSVHSLERACPWDGFQPAGDPATGPMAVGGDLAPATIVGAYRIGLFPWPTCDPALEAALASKFHDAVTRGEIPNLTPHIPGSERLRWWSPDPRGALRVDDLHLSRSLRAHLHRCGWTTTLNRCFRRVVTSCVRGEINRWITPELIEAYTQLHHLGHAHSVEVWDGDELVGGMYGVLTGRIYTGESMFFRRANASKVAFVDMARRVRDAGGVLMDTQTPGEHLKTFGAIEMPRVEFLALLLAVRDDRIDLVIDRLPASRLAI